MVLVIGVMCFIPVVHVSGVAGGFQAILEYRSVQDRQWPGVANASYAVLCASTQEWRKGSRSGSSG